MKKSKRNKKIKNLNICSINIKGCREQKPRKKKHRKKKHKIADLGPLCYPVLSHSDMPFCYPMDHSTPLTSVCEDSPGKNTGVGCHALLQGIFPTHRSNPGLSHCRWTLYHLSHQGSPRILEWVTYPFSRGPSQPRN